MYRNLGSLPIENWIPGKKIDIMSAHNAQVSLYTSHICMSVTYAGELS